jgi:small neutral amino acid transporter SnatA (MarC family)
MSPLLIKISKDFATLFTTIDPIGNVALFAALTASHPAFAAASAE